MVIRSSFLKQIRSLPQDEFDAIVQIMEGVEAKKGVVNANVQTLDLSTTYNREFCLEYENGPYVMKYADEEKYWVALCPARNSRGVAKENLPQAIVIAIEARNSRGVAKENLPQAIVIAIDWNRCRALCVASRDLPKINQFLTEQESDLQGKFEKLCID